LLQYPSKVTEESSAKIWYRNERLYTITRLQVPRYRLSMHVRLSGFFYHADKTFWNSLPDLDILTVLMVINNSWKQSFQSLVVWTAHWRLSNRMCYIKHRFTYLFYFYLLINSHIHRKIEQQLSGRCRISTCRAFSAAMNWSFSRSSTVIRDWFHDTPPTKNWSNSTL